MQRKFLSTNRGFVLVFFLSLLGPTVASDPFLKASSGDYFDVFKVFSPSGVTNYSTLTLDGGTLYIGARDHVYGRDALNIEMRRFPDVSWPVSKDLQDSCRMIPQSQGGKKCYNLIQIVQPLNNTHILICGTNFFTPQNKMLVRDSVGSAYRLEHDTKDQSPLCSFDPSDSVSSLMTSTGNGPAIFSTARSDLPAKISVVKTIPPDSPLMCNENMQGEHPNIVASFTATDTAITPWMEKVYFFSDEEASELGRRTPSYSSTVTQVCSNDIGGKNILANQWTSLLKLRLRCQTAEEFPLVFDLVTDVVQGRDGILYGTFTTRHEVSRTNAVCSFRLSDIQKVFNKGSFWEKDQKTDTYKAVKSSGDLQPGMCAYRGMLKDNPSASTSKDFPSSHLRFMSDHNLAEDVVEPAYPPSADGYIKSVYNGHLFQKLGGTFTKIAVDQVADIGGKLHDVIFVGTQHGQVYKFISLNEGNKVETVELARYNISKSNLPVISMKIWKDHHMLYVGTNGGVHQVSTSNCPAYTKICEFCDPCRMCVLSRDPYCGWDKSGGTCKDVNTQGAKLLQDVANGDAVTICGDLPHDTNILETVEVADGAKQALGHLVKKDVKCNWFKVKDETKREKIDNENGKYRINSDCQLEISDFDHAKDSATYECEYTARDTLVGLASYKVQPVGWIGPKSSTPPAVPVTKPTIGKVPNTNVTVDVVTDLPVEVTTSNSEAIGGISEATIAITAILAVTLVIAICVMVWLIRRRRCQRARKEKGKYPVAEREKSHESRNVDEPDGSPSGGRDNSTNNNNAQLLGIARLHSNREDAETPLLRQYLSATPQHTGKTEEMATTSRSPRAARSLDDLDRDETMKYIDEVDGAGSGARKNSNLEASSSMRDDVGRKRVPPARTKSMPGSSLYVVYAGKKLQCSTLQRNKQGSWMIEVPNISGLSDMVGAGEDEDEIIEILQDESNSREDAFQFDPAENNSSRNARGKNSGPKAQVADAKKAFFERPNGNSPTISYVTSTPNSKALAGSENGYGAQPFFHDQKTPLREQASKASLRSSHNSSEDSDSTVKGSCSTLKPEDTPMLPHQKEFMQSKQQKRRQYKHAKDVTPTKVPGDVTSSIEHAPLAQREASYPDSDGSLNKSSGSSDGDEQLHGRDKKSTRKSRNKPPDSPSKESRTSNGSSSGSDYKSARSSVISDQHDAR